MSCRALGWVLILSLPACGLSTAGRAEQDGRGGGGGASHGAGGAGTGTGGEGGSVPLPTKGFRVRITFDNGTGEALDGFPVLVRLDPGRIDYAGTAAGGVDLRFVDEDGTTVLPHEVESWTAGGDSWIWVRVPRIEPNSNDFIWIYYGDPGATDVSDPAAVWAGFAGVYHLSGDLAAVGHDSASGGHHGTTNGPVATGAGGRIGGAIEVDAAGRIDLTGVDDFSADAGQARTVEAWFRTAESAQQRLLSQEWGCAGFGIELGITNVLLRASLFTGDGTCNGGAYDAHYASVNKSYADDAWSSSSTELPPLELLEWDS